MRPILTALASFFLGLAAGLRLGRRRWVACNPTTESDGPYPAGNVQAFLDSVLDGTAPPMMGTEILELMREYGCPINDAMRGFLSSISMPST